MTKDSFGAVMFGMGLVLGGTSGSLLVYLHMSTPAAAAVAGDPNWKDEYFRFSGACHAKGGIVTDRKDLSSTRPRCIVLGTEKEIEP